MDAMKSDTGLDIPMLRVDGGGTANDLMMQFQSDILGIPIERHAIAETTALGAAYLAGLATDFWQDTNEIAASWESDKRFTPSMDADRRSRLYAHWQRAVDRSKNWQEPS